MPDAETHSSPTTPNTANTDTGLLDDAPRPTRSEKLLRKPHQADDERAGSDGLTPVGDEEPAEPTPFGADREEEMT